MLKIRLRRVGAKHKPAYRLVVADSRSPRDGRFVDLLGHYNPLNPEAMAVDRERAASWLKKGAQPTGTARRLLVKAGVIGQAQPAGTKKGEGPAEA
jgi:small subunit ribosomal protein S16